MIQIGTSGYFYSDWIERFYPAEANRNNYFSLYAQEFSALEIALDDLDLTGPNSLTEIVNQAPEGFSFSIRIQPVFSRHMTDDLAQFVEFIKTSGSEKIVCALVSYPKTFSDLPENREILVWLKAQVEIPLLVEMLSRDWIKKGIKEWFNEHALGFCCSDLPRLPGLVQPVDWVTGSIAYVRFHGRNYQNWESHAGQREQNDYTYDMMELAEWLPKIEDMDSQADLTLVMMNNTPRANAIESARMLKSFLGKG